jgi:repressor LexA
VRFDTNSEVAMERRPSRHIPLIGDVAAGTNVLAQQNVEDLIPLPTDFTGEGELFMLRVRGDSMIEAGILDGDFVVARQQQVAENGDIVVAGIPGDEATIKTFKKSGKTITLIPANETMKPMVFDADEVQVFGKLVTVMRKLYELDSKRPLAVHSARGLLYFNTSERLFDFWQSLVIPRQHSTCHVQCVVPAIDEPCSDFA